MGTRAARVLAAAAVVAGACVAAAAPAGAAPVRQDQYVRSFDGTRIWTHFFRAQGLRRGERAPTVLMGPGWAGNGATDPDDGAAPGVGTVGVGTLRVAGFNVLTWDPRGFGRSSGVAQVDSPRYEGRDVEAMIDWVARQPAALLDGRGDPRVGMAGGSYGGGIQLVAASMDKRIDAIVPVIAWHSLATSLMRNDTVKSGWDIPLYAAAAAVKARLNPFLAQSAAMAARAFEPSARERRFFAARGPGRRVARITAPTLLVQGTVDTLFTLREAVTNYRILHRHGVPVKMLWFCGGHGVCLTDPGDEMRMRRDTIAWFDRWLKGRGRVSTGPGFEWLDQRGRSWHAPRWPPAGAGSLTGSDSGTLTLVAEGGSGPADVPPGAQGIPSGSFAAAKASNAVDVTVRAGGRRSVIVGAPRLTLRYHGLAPKADARVLAQVVDDRSGVVLGNQITPIPVTLDGRPHAVTLPLEIVAATARPGERFTLQLVAQSTLYDTHPAGGSVTFDRVHVALPVVKRARPG